MGLCATHAAHTADIEDLLDEAFGPDRRSRTAYSLRAGTAPVPGLSFVCTEGDQLCGTISFSPLDLVGPDGVAQPALLLGPIAVAQRCRGQNLGRVLIMHGLAAARRQGHAVVMLIGDVEYYHRFGFSAAQTQNWHLPGPVEAHRVLALTLNEDAILPEFCHVRPHVQGA